MDKVASMVELMKELGLDDMEIPEEFYSEEPEETLSYKWDEI